ncbi:MAG: hypothetical protein DIU62_012045 [Pseudomonadota bacterium]|nr:MAG: hypothetical protein DIU62_02830 [Pseudomonadota bacterium]
MSDAPVAARIETIERGYEYLLAYAAQGRQDDRGTELRDTLDAMYAALEGLGELISSQFSLLPADGGVPDFLDQVKRDVAVARGAIALVLSRERIPSLLVDNLNASVHLRALLTDLFLVDQAGRVGARS